MKMLGTSDPVQHGQARTRRFGKIPAPLRDPQKCFHSPQRILKRVLERNVGDLTPPDPRRVASAGTDRSSLPAVGENRYGQACCADVA